MAEYLSPGIYVEEFDSGIKAMEGVGTSTAGFVGMAQKGPVNGLPVLITSMADYQRRFGGYLSERMYGNKRFLPYAVEQFFNNGGSSCYVMRVCEKDGEGSYVGGEAKGSMSASGKSPFLELKASNPGAWGNGIRAKLSLMAKSRTRVEKKTEENAGTGENAGKEENAETRENAGTRENTGTEDVSKTNAADTKTVTYKLQDASALQMGDMVCLQLAGKKSPVFFGVVHGISGEDVTLKYLGEGVKEWKFLEGSTEPKEPKDPKEEDPQNHEENPKDPKEEDPKDPKEEDPRTPEENPKDPREEDPKTPEEDPKEEDPNKTTGDSPQVFLYLAEWVLTIQDDTASEQYESISFNPDRSNYADNVLEKSQIVRITTHGENMTAGMMDGLLETEEMAITISLSGGSDGTVSQDIDPSVYKGEDGAPDRRTGLTAFKTLSDVSIMAIPGITDKTVQSDLVSHCEGMGNRFAILDMPLDYKEVSDLQEFRENVDTSYGAMYHPWLQCYDALAKRSVFLPPSGAMAGIYGRTDHSRGVHKAPANEVLRNCTGLSVNYNDAEQGKLNPKGINLIRALPGQGIRVWGARTCSSDGNWKYINVRRLFIFIEESIRANTNWAVFEPNDEMLWSRVEGTIRVFLTTQWRNGALVGSTADEAFFINIGKSTMTEDDILNGRLICVIGVAPVRPAEFVVFRITQKMEGAQ